MKKDKVLISVVLPVYNMAQYIRCAIDSILNQTFRNFELIIIDDASIDDTLQIIQSYADERILCVCNKSNLGNYPSRNIGVKISRGKYVAVMDGDDIALPNRLEMQYYYMENNLDVVALGTDFYFEPNVIKRKCISGNDEIILSLLDGYYCVLHPTLLIRASIMKQINGYCEKYKYASDYDLVCQLSFLGKIENLSESLMVYRRHAQQITQSKHYEQLCYAEEIRRNYQIHFINCFKSKEQLPVSDLHVSVFQLGTVIAYYTFAKASDSELLKDRADELLDLALKSLHTNLPVCLYNGLCGFACGLLYLIRNCFIEGSEDEILEELDEKIKHDFHIDSSSDMYYFDKKRYLYYRYQNRMGVSYDYKT